MVENFFGSTIFSDHTVIQKQNTVGYFPGESHFVGHDYHGHGHGAENAGGGITVKNGLVTGVGTLGGSSTEGDSPDQTIIGFTIRDGLITGLSKESQVYSGYFTAGSLRIYVTGGKITKVENI